MLHLHVVDIGHDDLLFSFCRWLWNEKPTHVVKACRLIPTYCACVQCQTLYFFMNSALILSFILLFWFLLLFSGIYFFLHSSSLPYSAFCASFSHLSNFSLLSACFLSQIQQYAASHSAASCLSNGKAFVFDRHYADGNICYSNALETLWYPNWFPQLVLVIFKINLCFKFPKSPVQQNCSQFIYVCRASLEFKSKLNYCYYYCITGWLNCIL